MSERCHLVLKYCGHHRVTDHVHGSWAALARAALWQCQHKSKLTANEEPTHATQWSTHKFDDSNFQWNATSTSRSPKYFQNPCSAKAPHKADVASQVSHTAAIVTGLVDNSVLGLRFRCGLFRILTASGTTKLLEYHHVAML
eukprot:2794649-Amphidinium_carterae.1